MALVHLEGRGRGVAEGRALRADTKRRGAPFTKARVRGTRKRLERSSRHENASPLARILNLLRRRMQGYGSHELARIFGGIEVGKEFRIEFSFCEMAWGPNRFSFLGVVMGRTRRMWDERDGCWKGCALARPRVGGCAGARLSRRAAEPPGLQAPKPPNSFLFLPFVKVVGFWRNFDQFANKKRD